MHWERIFTITHDRHRRVSNDMDSEWAHVYHLRFYMRILSLCKETCVSFIKWKNKHLK